MYEVFVDNRLVVLTENDFYIGTKPSLFVSYASYSKKVLALSKVLPVNVVLVVVCSNPELALEELFHGYHYLETGGGVVLRKENMVVIKRNGILDLPKGKIEKGESTAEGALREVEEECGIHKLKIINLLTVTYHTYAFNEKNYLKKNYWYLMETDFDGAFTPQLEEGITKVFWMPKTDWQLQFKSSYGSIQLVVDRLLQSIGSETSL